MKSLGNLLSVLGWTSAALWVAAHWIPPSYWMQINKIYVADAELGVPPQMTVDWKIYYSFAMRWRIVVKMAMDTGDAEFQAVCDSTGSRPFSPQMHLPRDMDLRWWIAPGKCDLTRGDYYIETTFNWERFGIAYSETAATNVFHVPPAAKASPAP